MTDQELKYYEELLLKKRQALIHELGYFGDKTVKADARDVAGS